MLYNSFRRQVKTNWGSHSSNNLYPVSCLIMRLEIQISTGKKIRMLHEKNAENEVQTVG